MVASLPDSADPSSVRVAARGHDLTLLNVEVQRRVAAEPRRESLAQLRADVERWRDAVKELDDADEAERAGLGFLGHLSEAAATSLARALSAGRGYHELAGMAGHLSASTATTLTRRREIAARKRAAQQELDAAVERLAGAEQPGQPAVFTEVCVLLEAGRPPRPRSS